MESECGKALTRGEISQIASDNLNKEYYKKLQRYVELKHMARVEGLKLANIKTDMMFSEEFDQYKTIKQKEAEAELRLEEASINLLNIKKERDLTYYQMKQLEWILKSRNTED